MSNSALVLQTLRALFKKNNSSSNNYILDQCQVCSRCLVNTYSKEHMQIQPLDKCSGPPFTIRFSLPISASYIIILELLLFAKFWSLAEAPACV